MIGYKGRIDKNNKIHNKNYHNKVKKHKGNKNVRKNNNADERAQLQKEIDEKLSSIVEENKRKQYDEWKLNIENEKNPNVEKKQKKNIENEKNKKKKMIITQKKVIMKLSGIKTT